MEEGTHTTSTTTFGGLANFGMQLPSEKSRKHLAPGAEAVMPEPDSVAVVTDNQLAYVESTQETAARTYNAFTVQVVPAATGSGYPGNPARLVGHDSRRQRLFITNNSPADPVVLGSLDQVSAGEGFMLPPGGTFDPQIQSELYACVPASGESVIPVGVWVEINA